MQNDMRDRLIKDCEELMCFCQSINCYKCDHKDIPYPRCMGVRLADHLIASDDVIVPPCKVGDIIYSTELNFVCQRKVKGFETFINAPVYAGATWKCNTNDFGKTVFLTKEEAEQKLN